MSYSSDDGDWQHPNLPYRPAKQGNTDVSEEQSGDIVIVGIDFGTTYSGAAFTWGNKIDQIEVITSWESDLHGNSDEEKAPTALSHASEDDGDEDGVRWGYSIPPEAEQIRWFKLLLLDERDVPDDICRSGKLRAARKYLRKYRKTAISVIAEYLRLLWRHCEQRIAETISRRFVSYARFHIVITVPAIWPQYARVRMREAAQEAGLLEPRLTGTPRLDIISEPEAAALATLRDMSDRSDIKAGDTFVVVDCGGGTADLISYEVTNTSPMVVREFVQGQGGLCGAVFVDEAFTRLLEAKFGHEAWKKMTPRTRQHLIQSEWEHGIKQAFDGKRRTWSINMPAECISLEALSRSSGTTRIEIMADEVRTAFDPVINQINAMVAEQIAAVTARSKNRRGPKYVILVGGFGRCKYLFSSLKNLVSEDIEVLQSRGHGPWTAICRGAVIHACSMRGLGSFTVDVQSRIARASYGVACGKYFDPDVHLVQDKYWDEQRLEWWAKNQVEWTLKIGDVMMTREPVTIIFSDLHPLSQKRILSSPVSLITSTATPPPSRINADVERLSCSICWETEIDASTLPIWTNPVGEKFYRLTYEIKMVSVGGTLDFSVYHNGKRYGSVNVVARHTVAS